MTIPTTIAVVGGGVLGLCVALRARQAGAKVTLVSREGGASAHAGGMLAPLCELDHAEPDIAAAGLDSVTRWQALLDELDISA
ncbi:MAG: FAD-dependent oxidoreductase, partial [Myxococcota bacterium]